MIGNPRFADFEALLDTANDRATRCIRCGHTATHHGERGQDGPDGCGWTYTMVLTAARSTDHET